MHAESVEWGVRAHLLHRDIYACKFRMYNEVNALLFCTFVLHCIIFII